MFGVEPRADILHRVVTWQLEKRRGTARAAPASVPRSRAPARSSASRRAAVPPVTAIAAPRSSSAAARRTGPRVRDFNPSLNKKVRALGLKMALSAKARAAI